MSKLTDQAYTQVLEAERLRMEVIALKTRPTASIVTVSIIMHWMQAAIDAVHLCRLACDILPDPEVLRLKRRLEAEEPGMWDGYILAEWLGEDDWLAEGLTDIGLTQGNDL